ncbi:hypothetical protein VOI54_08120 [Tamlana sp. 2201CG12-4]|uniref:hypothetical protein n=1 Tax=Tamlana sp. 2201CG12-4 TaxID=3112582 RepID=UPI002DB983B1|nr:hypothetical protein [Tamlana sp. 2201CG12-4]MEC3906983.1 hypothetical protein [Tamlana sp. 2201CG12-4]
MISHKYLICFLFSSALIMCNAQEGNYKFNNFGNRSILLAGNVTGSVSDLGLTYYNPSFLTDVENVGFSLNAKAYQLVSIKLDNPDQQGNQLSNTNFNSASTMAGGVFNLFDTKFAYSYLTKSNFNTNLNYSSDYLTDDILNLFPEAARHNSKISLNSHIKDDWAGLAWAHKFDDAFSIGVSAFASIYSYTGKSIISHTLASSSNDISFFQNTIGFKQKSYGLFFKIGANYRFPKFDLGLNINLPYLSIIDSGNFEYSKTIAGVSSEHDLYIDTIHDNLSSKRQEPLGISIGAGVPIKKGKLYFNVDYVSGIDNYNRLDIPNIDTGDEELRPVNFDEERKAVFNFGIGAELEVSERLKAYSGFTTDFNANKNSANIFDISSDDSKQVNIGENFYHLSFGVDWKLKWLSLISGITYANSKSSFISPYQIDFGASDINSNIDSQIKYTRWQFVIGIDIPVLSKKIDSLGINKED